MTQQVDFPTILVPATGGAADGIAMDLAMALTATGQPHVVGLHVKPIPAAISGGMGETMTYVPEFQDDIDRWAEEIRAGFEAEGARRELSVEWRCETGEITDILPRHARYADLTVMVADHDIAAEAGTVAAATLGSGRPTLIVPQDVVMPPWRHVMIAWDGGREAARAIGDALPLLHAASTIDVVTVDPPDAENRIPGADLAAYLARHGLAVEVHSRSSGEFSRGEALAVAARELGADLVVMGLYGHSRLREFMLGGVSLVMLEELPAALFVSH